VTKLFESSVELFPQTHFCCLVGICISILGYFLLWSVYFLVWCQNSIKLPFCIWRLIPLFLPVERKIKKNIKKTKGIIPTLVPCFVLFCLLLVYCITFCWQISLGAHCRNCLTVLLHYTVASFLDACGACWGASFVYTACLRTVRCD